MARKMSASSGNCGILFNTEFIEDEDRATNISPTRQEACRSLPESRINELKAAFSMLDKNKDGQVELSEMKDMLEGLGISTDDAVVQILFQKATQRDDGLVSEQEFLDWMASQQQISGSDDDIMEDLLAAFRVFDKDGNGYITRDELKTAMELIGERMTDTELDEMLKAIDTDKDGRINYEEFVKILL